MLNPKTKTKNQQVGDLSSLTALVRLDLSDSPRLRSLEPVLQSTSNSLKHLVAARCPGILSSSPSSPPTLLLPRGLALPRLRVVDLSSCALAAFDASTAPKLAALILSGNPGIEISNLGRCPELATLVVKGCGLADEALSSTLRGCRALSKLSAAHNQLRGGDRLDLSALSASLSELRLGHNDLRALPRGLSLRLRLLDAGANPKLGPLRSVAGELSRISRSIGSAGGVGKGNCSSWLRSVTLRGTAAALEEGYEAALVAAAPALRVLDDKKVSREGEGERERKIGWLPGAAAAAEDEGGKFDVEEERERKKKTKKRASASSASAVAVGKLAEETGLGLPPPPPLPEGQQKKSLELPLSLPPPPPLTPEAAATNKGDKARSGGGNGGGGATVIEVKQRSKKAKKGARGNENEAGGGDGVATGKEAARLLAAAAAGAGEDILEEVAGW